MYADPICAAISIVHVAQVILCHRHAAQSYWTSTSENRLVPLPFVGPVTPTRAIILATAQKSEKLSNAHVVQLRTLAAPNWSTSMRTRPTHRPSAQTRAAILLLAIGVIASVAAAPLLAQETSTTASTKVDAKGDPKARPPIFADLSFSDALAKANSENKLLIIKFTAEWCGPCKQMDKTTWRKQDVFDWAHDHAIVISVDVDKDTKTSEDHKIRAMPTMVAYRNGVEFDRTVGGMNASKTLSWMKDVKDGKSKAAAVARAKNSDGKSVEERMDNVTKLIQAGNYAAASPILIDLWKHMADDAPNMVGVRVSFFASDIEQACTEHKPTRDAFIKIRDENEAKLKASPDYDTLTDWIVLNKAVGQPEKTLEWFDRVKTTDNGKATARRLLFLYEPLIQERGDLRDISIVTDRPLDTLLTEFGRARRLEESYGERRRSSGHNVAFTRFYDRSSLLHAALIFDNRAREASEFRGEALRLDNTPAMRLALVEAAIKHIPESNPARATISNWAVPLLDQADAAVKAAPNADLSSRAAAARNALK
jgi:thiol-disulfide isomerase/thioredoxin